MNYLWSPPNDLVENSNVLKFMKEYGISNYNELVKRSSKDIEWFWSSAIKELDCQWFKPFEKVMDSSEGIQWTKWFQGGKINVVHNALDKHAISKSGDKLAFIWLGEDGAVEKYTYEKLFKEVNQFSNYLKTLGLRKGDVVATLMPMIPETVITLFATLKLGAIFLPIFSGFGPDAVYTRLENSEAKVIVTKDISHRRGKIVEIKNFADPVLNKAKKLEKVVVVGKNPDKIFWKQGRDVLWNDVIKSQSQECRTEELDPEDPALLLYTSGTTGTPKGVVISHAGALLQPAKEIYFNMDFKSNDTLLWVTDIGWMMGPWQIIGSQHLGGTHLIFEGAPDYPDPDRLWRMIDDFQVSHLGGSATIFRLLKGYGDEWIKKNNLSSIRIMGNTGETLDNKTWLWLLKVVGKEKCPIINLSGGTEIFGCFILPLPIMPLKPSTLGGPGLGMDVDIFNDNGESVRGEIGYLVCKSPSPSMTRGFWKDSERYLDTYWSRWPHIWNHGDWASIDNDGFWFLHGRVDDVIKIAGKRLGPAEVEFILNQNAEVRESAAIGMPHETKGEKLVCFISLNLNHNPSKELEDELRRQVIMSIGKPFAPDQIIFLKDLPKNRAGKIMRRIMKAILVGQPTGDTSVIENIQSLDELKGLLQP